ncbi:hypothetical protein BKA70DRAFT_1231624 [Coprinopsis sp. MPI-PUGE-AT-0042]|nr:hypothetical protein BKA70DRAFT_1231624 [Coprinopsis sp. MPI-PUGE-AT-0042]
MLELQARPSSITPTHDRTSNFGKGASRSIGTGTNITAGEANDKGIKYGNNPPTDGGENINDPTNPSETSEKSVTTFGMVNTVYGKLLDIQQASDEGVKELSACSRPRNRAMQENS